MKLFSHRKGIIPIRDQIQKDSMDQSLRNRLWNCVCATYQWQRNLHVSISRESIKGELLINLINDYFKMPIDEFASIPWWQTYDFIKKFFMTCEWNKVYDFIEFIGNTYAYKATNDKFRVMCNGTLKEEASAYRFVGTEIVEITSEEEIAEIEQALSATISPVNKHLSAALELFSNREKPDYRNSIKESISAVEAICKIISKDSKATLHKALQTIEDQGKIKLHPALKEAFSKLYGYAGDEGGIRHALTDEPTLDVEDAKYMLVSCSAFINYLVIKSDKSGIKL